MKRGFDVVVSTIGLVALSPALALITVAVMLDGRGPVIFRQERVGRHGTIFRIHKFRTMTHGHEGLLVSTSNDVRVTRVGRVLRQYQLDELPQLIDVLRGDMSLVGPRPEVPRYVDLWTAAERDLILSVRPGITDPASIAFRHEGKLLAAAADPHAAYVSQILPRKTAIYVDYVRNRSFVEDLRIIGRTLASVTRA